MFPFQASRPPRQPSTNQALNQAPPGSRLSSKLVAVEKALEEAKATIAVLKDEVESLRQYQHAQYEAIDAISEKQKFLADQQQQLWTAVRRASEQ